MGKVAHIYLVGPVGIFEDEEGNMEGFTLQSVISQVQSFKDQDISRFNFRMKGPGGYVDIGEKIFDYMRSLSTKEVRISTEQIGNIASMMTKLFLAADVNKGEQRLVKKGANFMIHNPSGGADGDADQIRERADELEATEKEMRRFYKEETGITDAGLDGMMKIETEMTSEEAISLGFATGYVGQSEPIKAIAMIKSKSKKMSKEKTVLNTILSAIKALKDDPKKDVAIDLILEGGSTLRINSENEEELIGSTAVVVDADGGEVPAPEGEHTLDDGRMVVIDSSNTVTEIKEVADPEPEPDTELAKVKQQLSDLEKTNKELQDNFDKKLDEAVEAKLKEVETAVEELQEETEKIEVVKEELKAMKTVFKVKADRNFTKEMKDRNAETRYDEGKAKVAEAKGNKPKFKRGTRAKN